MSSVAVGIAVATFVVMIGLSLAASAGWRSSLEPDARRRFERDAESTHEAVVTQFAAVDRLVRSIRDAFGDGLATTTEGDFRDRVDAEADLADAEGLLNLTVVRRIDAASLTDAELDAWVEAQRIQLEDQDWTVRGSRRHRATSRRWSSIRRASSCPASTSASSTPSPRRSAPPATPAGSRSRRGSTPGCSPTTPRRSPGTRSRSSTPSTPSPARPPRRGCWRRCRRDADPRRRRRQRRRPRGRAHAGVRPAPLTTRGADAGPVDFDDDTDVARYAILGGTPLELVVTDPDGVLSETSDEPLIVLGTGAALSVLLAVLVYVLARSRDMAMRMVEEATASLRRSEEHFRALVQHGSDLILVADGTWNVRYTSPSVTQLLGYAPDALVGQPLLTAVHPDDVEGIRLKGDGGRGTVEARASGTRTARGATSRAWSPTSATTPP